MHPRFHVLRWLAAPALGLTLGWASAAQAEKAASQHRRVYVVEAGDTLWDIASAHGCSVDALASANEMESAGVLRVDERLTIPQCKKARATVAEYTVRPGDTLGRIARERGVDLAALKAANGLDDSLIKVGQTLSVPRKEPEIRLVPGQSVGRPTRGRLQSAAALPRNRGWHLRRPERIYGAAHVVDYTVSALRAVRSEYRGLHPIAIGDLSARGGGAISGHRSHQSGRDVDIGLCYRKKPKGYPHEFVPAVEKAFHADACWVLIRELAATATRPGGVEHMFLDYDVQGWVYEAARRDGVSRRALGKIFQYPNGPWTRDTLVQHVRKHDDHLHVRFACVKGDANCQP